MPGPQRQTQEDYVNGFVGTLTGAPTATSAGAPVATTRYQDVGNDNGRGPGSPGGRGRGAAGAQEVTVAPGNVYDTSPDSVAGMLAGMPPEKVADIQRKMVAIGLLPASFSTFGFVDEATRSAFTELLDYTNRDPQGGDRWDNTLDGLATSGTSMADAKVEAAKMTQRQQAELQFRTQARNYVASDPASVRLLAEDAFKSALGRKPREDEMAKFVSTFMSAERSDQDNQFGTADAIEGFNRGQDLAAADSADAFAGEGSESDQLWNQINVMIADSPFKDQISPGSRTRSYEEQVRLWNNYQNGTGPMAARPGTSRHGNGEANDLKYASPEARAWVLANAERYGLHFPIYDPSKPRSKDESWHVELLSSGDRPRTTGGGVAPVSRAFSTQSIDPAARAQEQIRKDNPVEVGAYDIGTQFNEFMNIMSRSVV